MADGKQSANAGSAKAKTKRTKTTGRAVAKRAGGRPNEWDKIGAERICEETEKLCLLGATDAEIAEWFEVSERTINNWKDRYSQFMQSLKKGKMGADANVAQSLYRRAMGYERIVEKVGKDGNGQTIKITITECVEPDTTAIIFWLKNRHRQRWNEKLEHVHMGPDGGAMQYEDVKRADIEKMTPSEIAAAYHDLATKEP